MPRNPGALILKGYLLRRKNPDFDMPTFGYSRNAKCHFLRYKTSDFENLLVLKSRLIIRLVAQPKENFKNFQMPHVAFSSKFLDSGTK